MSTLRVEPLFVFLSDWGGEKKSPPESRQTFGVPTAQTSGLVNFILSVQTVFSLFFLLLFRVQVSVCW